MCILNNDGSKTYVYQVRFQNQARTPWHVFCDILWSHFKTKALTFGEDNSTIT